MTSPCSSPAPDAFLPTTMAEVTTALWLDRAPVPGLMRWEWLRLCCVALVLLLALQSGFSGVLLLLGSVYCLANAVALPFLAGSSRGDELPAIA